MNKNTKKKILFLLHLPPPVHGSSMVGSYIKNSGTINNAFNCRYINIGTSHSIDEIGRSPLKKIGRYLSILGQVLIQIIRFKPTLCYLAITAKGPAFYKDALLVFIVKLLGIKLVYHFHNKGVKSKQHKALSNFLYKKTFKNTYGILLSKYLYSDIEKYFTEDKVFFCPNGIPAKKSNENPTETKSTSEILFLSNLIESKGVFVLLEACNILQNRKVPFHCNFVGGEGDITAAQLEQKIHDLGLSENVSYLGKKYGDEKEMILSRSDIFAFPTFYHNECFPLVLLEAMQMKLPVVSTFEGGIPDIIEDEKTGFIIPQQNANLLADKLETLLLNTELRKKMGNAALIKFEKSFTIHQFENKLKEILCNI